MKKNTTTSDPDDPYNTGLGYDESAGVKHKPDLSWKAKIAWTLVAALGVAWCARCNRSDNSTHANPGRLLKKSIRSAEIKTNGLEVFDLDAKQFNAFELQVSGHVRVSHRRDGGDWEEAFQTNESESKTWSVPSTDHVSVGCYEGPCRATMTQLLYETAPEPTSTNLEASQQEHEKLAAVPVVDQPSVCGPESVAYLAAGVGYTDPESARYIVVSAASVSTVATVTIEYQINGRWTAVKTIINPRKAEGVRNANNYPVRCQVTMYAAGKIRICFLAKDPGPRGPA